MNPLLLGPLADLIKSVVNKIWPDPAQQAEAQFKLAQLMQSGELAQLAADTDLAKAQIGVNATEATSSSLFVSGWRPAIGWLCAAALGYQYIVRPVVSWGVIAAGHPLPPMPGLDDNLWQLLLGMLGLGGLRTVEKLKGAAGK